jgi:SET domain-containing protein
MHARARAHKFNVPKEVDDASQLAKAPRQADAPSGGRRIQVRRSGVHGKGVFALVPIPKGEVIIEYKGEIITWPEAQRRHPHDPSDPNHTFYFHIDDKRVIDAAHGGNAARWINHACSPTARPTRSTAASSSSRCAPEAGEELFYDYGLIIDDRYTQQAEEAVRMPLRLEEVPRHDACPEAMTPHA